MAKNKILKILGVTLLTCLLFLGSAFGTSKVVGAKKFNNLVNSANQKFNMGNYDEAIALYNEALQIKNDTGVKNQLFLAQNCKVYQPNKDKVNDKNNGADKKDNITSDDSEVNVMDGFTEEEKKILAQVSNININDPIVNGYDGTTSNNTSSNKKNYSYTTQKNVQRNTKVNTSNVSSAAGNINTSSNSSSNNTSAESNNSQSTNSSSNTNTNSNSGANKEARIQALYQQEQKDLAPYVEKINGLQQESSQLTLKADALPGDSASKAELLKKKVDVEQEIAKQLEQCKKIANDYLQKAEAIKNE